MSLCHSNQPNMDLEMYISNLLQKGYGKTKIVDKLQKKTDIPREWLEIAFDVAFFHKENIEWNKQLLNGELNTDYYIDNNNKGLLAQEIINDVIIN